MSPQKQMKIKDSLWKGIVEDLFEDFISFFMPDLYPKVQFDKGVEFLDKELESLFPESEESKGYVDKLVKVYFKDGKETWIFIHVEIQGYKDKYFSKRMFKYFYRVYDKYQKEIIAIAIFTDSIKSFKPDSFQYSFFKTELVYKYRTYKLLDQDEASLEKMSNPFALVVLAGLYSIKSKEEVEKKYKFKIKLIKLLLKTGYSREKVRHIFIFVDGLLLLPAEVEMHFKEEIQNLSGGKTQMGLTAQMSNLGQIAFKEGEIKGEIKGKIEGEIKGEIKGKKSLLIHQIERKWGVLQPDIKERLNKINRTEELEVLGEKVVTCEYIEDLFS